MTVDYMPVLIHIPWDVYEAMMKKVDAHPSRGTVSDFIIRALRKDLDLHPRLKRVLGTTLLGGKE